MHKARSNHRNYNRALNNMIISREQASFKHKHGIDLWVYPTIGTVAGLVFVDVKEGHFQEFYDLVSTFTYYVIEGSGTFLIDSQPQDVSAGDYVSIPPKTKIYYLGTMKMVLVTTPAWKAENEVHVRFIQPKVKGNTEPLESPKSNVE
jgi:mannose-6-phosphate isomerase-like protein (cupin superfamily)